MQFNITTDYAIRTVILLAKEQKKLKTEYISEMLGIPLSYLRKIIKKLNRDGIVTIHQGCQGGITLAESAESINLYDVIAAIEPTIKQNRCLEDDCHCGKNEANNCPVKRLYENLQAKMEDTLKGRRIVDMIE